MKPPIWKSRKLWIAVCDAVFSISTLVVTFILSDQTEIRVLVLGVLGILQPTVAVWINAIAVEDAAVIAANGATKSATIAAKE